MTEIEANITTMAQENNWVINEKTISRIAKAKERFFGIDNWKKCPCYPPEDTTHGCGTEACTKDILEQGVCHCNLYLSPIEKKD